MSGLKIKKGDKVKVISGKDKGKIGDVLKVLPTKAKLIVSGVNMIKKHMKPTQSSEGQILHCESSIHVSNVSHLDPNSSDTITKIGYKILDNGKKIRFAKKSGEVILDAGK